MFSVYPPASPYLENAFAPVSIFNEARQIMSGKENKSLDLQSENDETRQKERQRPS